VQREDLDSKDQAMGWLRAEHQVLMRMISYAASEGFGSHAWQPLGSDWASWAGTGIGSTGKPASGQRGRPEAFIRHLKCEAGGGSNPRSADYEGPGLIIWAR
jgi:hypothetical protein